MGAGGLGGGAMGGAKMGQAFIFRLRPDFELQLLMQFSNGKYVRCNVPVYSLTPTIHSNVYTNRAPLALSLVLSLQSETNIVHALWELQDITIIRWRGNTDRTYRYLLHTCNVHIHASPWTLCTLPSSCMMYVQIDRGTSVAVLCNRYAYRYPLRCVSQGWRYTETHKKSTNKCITPTVE